MDVKLKSPSPSIIYEMKIGFIMDKESTEARSHDDVVRNPIGTGAYEFVEWIRGSHLTLGANEDSWGALRQLKALRRRF
ncbi:MAG: hypothetical protein ACLFN4_00055 [Candidatus Acetothermia bacterium]